MLTKGDWLMIAQGKRDGKYLKDIAEELGVHPRTVRRALDRGGPGKKGRPPGRSKLDPYKSWIDQRLGEGVWNAMVLYREIQERGYSGEVTLVRDYIRPKRVLRSSSRRTVRFETLPGQQMQNDWGEIWTRIGGTVTKVYFSVNTLGYSRRFHFWGTDGMDAEHTYEGIIRAFEWLGGGTREVLVDNQKTAVITHRTGERPVFHPRFLDLAAHYGFEPKDCQPYRARTKGKDERMVGYVKANFFVRYASFESLDHLNRLAERWLREEADRRLHGTVREIVADRFAREAPELLPLPSVRFDTSCRETRRVAWDGYLEVRGNRYSVPADLCGQTVVVRIGLDDTFRVYDAQETLRACHRIRPYDQGGWVTVAEHQTDLWKETFQVEKRELSVYEEVASCNESPSSKRCTSSIFRTIWTGSWRRPGNGTSIIGAFCRRPSGSNGRDATRKG
jgi:transposase